MNKLLRLSASCALVALASSPALADDYSGYAHFPDVSVSPRRIYITAYKDEDTVEVAPARVSAYAQFRQHIELNNGGTQAKVRFGLVFDPDNIVLATFSGAVSDQTATVSVDSYDWVTLSATSPITLPSTLKKFGSWCSAVDADYTIDGSVWAQLPDVYDIDSGQPLVRSQEVQVVVDCRQKKTTFKLDLKKLPTKLIAPNLKPVLKIKAATK